MKVRFDGLDVQAMVALLQRTVLGRRVVNIYDGDTIDSYIFKLEGDTSGPIKSTTTTSTTNDNEITNVNYTATTNSSNKEFLLLESGIRCHLTNQYTTSKNVMPTPFVAKLRKHLRSLRLEKIIQLGTDRVILFQFNVGQSKHFIILELYSKGNIILCDKDYIILALLRSHIYQNNNNNNNDTNNNTNDENKNQTNTTTTTNNNKQAPSNNVATSAAGAAVQVGQVYPVTYATSLETIVTTSSSVPSNDNNELQQSDTQETQVENKTKTSILEMTNSIQIKDWIHSQIIIDDEITSTVVPIVSKKGKKKQQQLTLKTILLKTESGIAHYGPALIEHCILIAELQPNISIQKLINENDTTNDTNDKDDIDIWNRLLISLQKEGKHIIDSLQEASKKETTGYILYRIQKQQKQEQDNNEEKNEEGSELNKDNIKIEDIKIFEEFVPHLLKQHEKHLYIKYINFSYAVDDFFYQLANQKAIIRSQVAEITAINKLEKIKIDQLERINLLQYEQNNLYKQGKIIQLYSDSVNKALLVINSLLDNGMDWDQLEQVVHIEKIQKKNPIALLIHELDLKNDSMILRLPDIIDDYDNNDENDDENKNDTNRSNDINDNQKTIDIKILLNETAHANASRLFAKYRSSKEKSQKTIDSSAKALKAAEDNAKKQLIEAQKRQRNNHTILNNNIVVKRIYHWYEKFHWFITSDNYLVVGGKDAHQNELLVKRYLRVGDAYLHADIFGASSCILRAKRKRIPINKKNNNNNKPNSMKTEIIPLSDIALREAGNFTICHSNAWNTKMITSAWYVESYQVTKTAPTGEYLTTGSFMIRGKKNYLPPTSPLEMGLGILFRISDDDIDSINRHKNERRDFALIDLDNIDDNILTINEDEEEIENNLRKDDGNKEIFENTNDKSDETIDHLELEKVQEESKVISEHEDEDDDAKEVQKSDNIQNSDDSSDNDQPEDDGDQGSDESVPNLSISKQAENDENSNTVSESILTDCKYDDQKQEQPQQKRGLSVRDRKLIKKYGSLEEANRILESINKDKVENGKDELNDDVSSKVIIQPQAPSVNEMKPKRGKKTKDKLALKKYADQDDEDRKLALMALQGGEQKSKKKKGSSINKKGKGSTVESLKQQQVVAAQTVSLLEKDSSSFAAKLPEDVKIILAECVTVKDNSKTKDNDIGNSIKNDAVDNSSNGTVRWDKLDADTLEQLMSLESIDAQLAAANRLLKLKQTTRIDNFSASLGGIIRAIRKYGHETIEKEVTNEDNSKRKTKNEKNQELSKWKKAVTEEGIPDELDDDDNAVDDTIEISKLTGKPHLEDLLLYCVPVCGPYSSLQQYTYRVKLTPGNLKRGKAVKQCIEMFLRTDKSKALSASQEKQLELIKKVNDNDWIQVMCPDTKISAAGASKAIKASNKTKKSTK